jgi:hypothetical protein
LRVCQLGAPQAIAQVVPVGATNSVVRPISDAPGMTKPD